MSIMEAIDKVAADMLTSEASFAVLAFTLTIPGHPAVALQAEIDVSCAASKTRRAALHPLLALTIGKLLLAGSRCGELAHA
ncbi:MAG: hypothetical protein WBW93_19975 [Steroidobacteraceae bacterium]